MMIIGTWLGRLVVAGVVTAAVAACSNSTSGDDTAGDGSPSSKAGDAGGDASTTRVTNDAGVCITGCHQDDGCTTASQCASGVCTAGACVDPSCTDGKKDGTETAPDCGGICSTCSDGLACAVDGDCTSKSCDSAGTKLCLPPTDTDGIANGNETDKDCGSGGTNDNAANTHAPACPDSDKCVTGADCVDLICTGGTCAAATCGDGLKNGKETGTDCGNGAVTGCAACADGGGCKIDSDCTSLSCDTTTNVCLKPTSGDGIQNGNETDVDCGSGGTGEDTSASLCPTGLKCVSYADCVADGCNYKGICIAERSCAQHSGGDTCGAGEIDELTDTEETGSAHESCCASLPLPGQTTRLDKYEITAGRMREFVNRTGGDIATAWANVTDATAKAQIRPQDVQYLPTANDAPTIGGFKYNYQQGGSVVQASGLTLGLYEQIGPAIIFSDEPSVLQGCYIGKPGSGSYGHPTYYFDDTTMSQVFGAGPHGFMQAQLDEKSLNCVTQLMLVAFCAWDGGHLASSDELNAAWTSTYPWGSSPSFEDTYSTTVPGRINPTYDAGNGQGDVNRSTSIWSVLMPLNNGGKDVTSVNLMAPQYNLTNWNPAYPTLPTSLRYYWPPIDPAQWGNQVDESYEIAAPGRFIHDVAVSGDSGWYDLGGNLIEATSTVVGTDNSNRDSLPTVYWNGGSFEGHGEIKNGFTENIMTKYGKTGGRCAR